MHVVHSCVAILGQKEDTHTHTNSYPPSANGTTIRARSTKTVFVRCWDTPTDSVSRNFTKQTREVTGKGESLEKNTRKLCKNTNKGHFHCFHGNCTCG